MSFGWDKNNKGKSVEWEIQSEIEGGEWVITFKGDESRVHTNFISH